MKKLRKIFTIVIFTATIYTVQGQQTRSIINGSQAYHAPMNDSLLIFFTQQSDFTDPAEYAGLYDTLPDSLPELCRLIKSQFIHPYAELPRYKDVIPQERWNESFRYVTARSILESLVSYDKRGLMPDRAPEHRLVLGCREYALVLASVLRHRGIPTRLRAGHVPYLIPDFHTSHTLCEVWNSQETRWMLVDPGFARVDLNPDLFDFSHKAWLAMRRDEIDVSDYGVPGRYTGLISLAGKVCYDLAALQGKEVSVLQYAPLLDEAFNNGGQLTPEHMMLLDEVCRAIQNVDKTGLTKLQTLYENTPDLQMTRTFNMNSK